ncbi:MAG: mevalonate kinase [Chitinophagaceae bacterium]|nr:mevalonate kinase [Chitinophagaceae bacterium]
MENFNSKVLLFGEYSVISNHVALVMPCDQFRGQLNFFETTSQNTFASASNEYLKKFSRFIAARLDEHFVLEVKRLEYEIERGLFFESNIPQGYGLGSSGALVVAIFLRYLKKAREFKDEMKNLTWEKVQKLKDYLSQMESFFHGTSSGLDPLSIFINRPILFKGDKQLTTVELPERKENGENVIFLLNTGIPRSTSKLVNHFLKLYNEPDFKNKINMELVQYATDSIDSFLGEDTNHFYQNLEKLSRFQFEEFKSFIPGTFHHLVQNGLDHGDYFLKLCGAGGGGYILGFARNWDAAQEQLKGHELDIIYRF